MGKPKNKSKSRDLVDDDSDIDIPQEKEEEEEEEGKHAAKQSKKDKKKKKKTDDWEDDIASELAALSVEANVGKTDENGMEDEPVVTHKKEKKKTRGKPALDEQEVEMDGEEDVQPKAGKKKQPAASFQMLMMDDDDDSKSQSDDNREEERQGSAEPTKQQKKKEKKKKGKDKKQEDEDLDAILAEIEKPKESKKSKKEKKKAMAEALETEEGKGEATKEAAPVQEGQEAETKGEDLDQEEDSKRKKKKKKEKHEEIDFDESESNVVTMEDLEDEDDHKKKRKKKKGKKDDEDTEEGGKGEEEEEGEGTVKTAAQKKKEKKEREKLKKMEEKKKQLQKKETKAEGKTAEGADGSAAMATEAAEDKASGDEEEKDSKKKKKKKGDKKEEEKKKKPKAPVAAIKEMLKKQREEEERMRQEEEERIRKEEEEYQRQLEQKRLEDEKRAEKKRKKKETMDRLRQEGKLLTAKQKMEKKRAQQMLESMKEQGIELPAKEEGKAKRPVYMDKKKKKKPQQQVTDSQENTPSPTDTPAETPVNEEAPELPGQEPAEKPEQVEAPDVEEEEDEAKDAWDMSSEDEEEEQEASSATETTKAGKRAEKVEENEEEDEDEEESEESEEESEEEEEDSSEEESEESEIDDERTPAERAADKIQKRHEVAEQKRTVDDLRAPVVCVLGHVDTGKTKILDKLRRTNVQDGEAGGITQQIGATNVPHDALREKTTMCKEFQKKELKLPGLLIIDTPGHESFSNLRSRGSSLCDIAILVIDIMHGLEPQTIESINLLKDRKTPFVVALNKIDRLYQWKSNPNSDVANTIKRQTPMCKQEYDERSRDIIVQLAEQGLNASLFYENKNPKEYISLVPTSAHSGDGMGNLVALICELTQNWLAKKISYSEELHATVMEVKALPGLGTTIDVILVNGKLCEGQQVVIAGTEGPIVTQIRGLLMPQPMKELRVKSQYEHFKEVKAAQGVKVIGKDLEKALAGLPMFVAYDEDEVEYYREEISNQLKEVLNSIKLTERGVFVSASTLGSLEALLEFLRTSKIPYAGINIGPIHKKDIMKASVMLEHDDQYAVILAFDVKVERDAQEMADSLGVKIFTADIIYHLFDAFMLYRENLKKRKQDEFKHIAVFPCKLRVLPQFIFNSRDPIVMGVMVEAGFVKEGTPICVPSKEFCDLGRITSIEVNHKQVDMAKKGQEVCIKIECPPGDTPKLYGRHFEHTDMLVSKVSRTSIDAVKDYFRDEMTKTDWSLMLELKKMFNIL